MYGILTRDSYPPRLSARVITFNALTNLLISISPAPFTKKVTYKLFIQQSISLGNVRIVC